FCARPKLIGPQFRSLSQELVTAMLLDCPRIQISEITPLFSRSIHFSTSRTSRSSKNGIPVCARLGRLGYFCHARRHRRRVLYLFLCEKYQSRTFYFGSLAQGWERKACWACLFGSSQFNAPSHAPFSR